MATVGWTLRPQDGFLVLDRDGDGLISSGRELFGNSTPYGPGLSGGRPFTGFNALALFDEREHGGNGNGVIDRDDAVYSRLRVWFDRNRDGISDPHELVDLAALGVDSIGLLGRSLNRTDAHGNVLWFGDTFEYTMKGKRYVGNVVDVILRTK